MSYDPERITFFAKTDARGKNTPFGIKAKDRTRHVYVIGKTGMGKSTLLENMAVQDIKNGEGFAFIDPHGQTAETLLDYIPEERIKDVLYFAPHDTDFPVSFNVMEDVGPDKRHLVVSGLMSVFKKIWVDAWSARMEYILSNSLLALLEYPDSTLLGVNRMLSDKNYRKKVVDNLTDPGVKAFWVDEFAKYNERYMQEAGDSIKNKIGQFTANPIIRNIIGQPKSSFDIRKIMDEKKILIMNLSKGLIGETNANLLGSMLTTRIYLAAMSRADKSPRELEQMPNFYFYVDEFQSFANSTFANILSEARKYKLNLTIAHQYIEQMEEDVRNAVFGNVGTIVSFRVGPFDAEVLETVFSPKFYAVDIVNLGFAQIYLSLMIDGIGSPPFSAITLPPIEFEGASYKDVIIHSSREQFAFKRAQVEKDINLWHGIGDAPAAESTGNQKPAAKNYAGQNDNKREHSPRNDSGSQTKTPERKPAPDRTPKDKSHSSNDRRSESKSYERSTRRESSETKPSVKPSIPAPPAGKNLNELRSVLASLSTKDDSSGPKPVKPSEGLKKPSSVSNHKKPTEDLRSALAGVVGNSVEQSKEKIATISTPAPKAEPEEVQGKFSPHVKKPKNNLDPKQLERMMRVNTNDKTSLK